MNVISSLYALCYLRYLLKWNAMLALYTFCNRDSMERNHQKTVLTLYSATLYYCNHYQNQLAPNCIKLFFFSRLGQWFYLSPQISFFCDESLTIIMCHDHREKKVFGLITTLLYTTPIQKQCVSTGMDWNYFL